jgi:alanyl-tRNA synthetase
MTHQELREKYLSFFEAKGHKRIPSAPLIPENDATVLFTTAGMHPLVPFLLGEKHPAGDKLTSCQKCVRTSDIEEVGDDVHLTFFEMLGNWGLGGPASTRGGEPTRGGYWKKEAIEWSWEFLTDKKWLGLDKNKLAVSVFEGDKNAPLDEESYNLWRDSGVSEKRIVKLPKANNWWETTSDGPCGPDTEMFYWTGEEDAPKEFDANDIRWVEIWNDVFMQYNKTAQSTYEPLKQKNVDTGMGLERVLAALNGKKDVYETELFSPIIKEIEKLSPQLQNNQDSFEQLYSPGTAVMKNIENLKQKTEEIMAVRIIADHIKTAIFMLAEKLEPSNVGRGYVLRRLIRRAVRYGKLLEIKESFTHKLVDAVLNIYKDTYFELKENKDFIEEQLIREEEKFEKTLEKGLKEFDKGLDPFILFTSYGFPMEMIKELAEEKGIEINEEKFKKDFEKHQELSRTASAGMFKGGMADNSEMVVKYHTTTHLLHAALRKILGQEVEQKGSNLNAERLRFDFSYGQKMTPEQIRKVEDLVNEKIQEKLDVKMEEMSLEDAKKSGAIGLFAEKYGDKVKVYTIGDFSKEICGGPHVENIGALGRFKIIKEEAVSAGVRRIKAVLE